MERDAFFLVGCGQCGVLFALCETHDAIVRGTRGITADTALRLGRFSGQTPEFWMNLQRTYDLVVAERDIADELKRIRRVS